MEIQLGNVSDIIHLAITPAFLLVGVGTQIRVLIKRLARVTERSRTVEARLAEKILQRKAEYEAELLILYRRMRIIHWAITLSTVCALLICMVIVALFADTALFFQIGRPMIGLLIGLLFTLAMLALIGSFSLWGRGGGGAAGARRAGGGRK